MRRPLAAALIALGLCSCHEDPTVQEVFIPIVPSALGLTSTGGSASASAAAAGIGGAGGGLLCFAQNSLSIGTITTQPVAPVAPTPPSPLASDVVVPNLSPSIPLAPGNVFVNSSITTAAGAVTYEPATGDVVVSATLSADDSAAVPSSITLSAPNGTVWVTGTVRTVNTDGTSDGQAAGAITINAARIVITGTLDASGEVHAGGTGGAGGALTLNAGPGGVLLGNGSLLCAGAQGTTGGGNGGAVSIDSALKLDLYGTINADGGPAVGPGNDVAGGDGGLIDVDSVVSIDMIGTFTSRGGLASTSTGTGALGGDGGDMPVIASLGVPLRLYGTLDVAGGAATATDVGGGLQGGIGGLVELGNGGNPLRWIETGVGTYDLSGGSGEASGGDAADPVFNCGGGQLLIGGTLLAQGGASETGGGGDGGAVGAILSGPGPLASSATINVTSGSSGGGAVPFSGGVSFTTTNGDLTVSGSIVASAGSSSVPVPANGGAVVGLAGAGGGSITWTASVTSEGGSSTSLADLDGGNGGSLTLTAASASGSIVLNASVLLDGGDSTGIDLAGAGGILTLLTVGQEISMTGSFLARGGTALGTGTGGLGGQTVVDSNTAAVAGGDITLAAGSTVDVSGGAGTTGGNARNGPPGAAASFDADNDDDSDLAPPVTVDGRVNLAGSVFARGAATDGDGGNVLVDGRSADGLTQTPATTTVIVTASGVGTAGAVAAQ